MWFRWIGHIPNPGQDLILVCLLIMVLMQELDVHVTGIELSIAASEAAILRANEQELRKVWV